jgi:predicted dehydrogenase
MLERERLDAVYICVPPFAHGPLEQAVIERDLPFFVEKPLATNYETAERIHQAITRRGLISAVGYHWRYLDIVERAQELLSTRPARLALGYWLDFTPPPAWWRHEAESGGQFVEQTTHIFDLARLLVGEPLSVYAAGSRLERAALPDSDVCDASVAVVQFEGGPVGSFASTCLLNWPHRIGLHLFCEGLAIELSEWEIMIDVGQGRPVTRAEGDAFVREDRAFIDAVQGKHNAIRAPYGEALRTQQLTVGAAQSIREGRVIDLSEVAHA